MVQMGVREEYSVYAFGRHNERRPVSFLKLPFLVQPAVNEQLNPVNLKKMPRTRYVLCCAQKP
jgi:hypothetical protein